MLEKVGIMFIDQRDSRPAWFTLCIVIHPALMKAPDLPLGRSQRNSNFAGKCAALLLATFFAAIPALANDKDAIAYGVGLIVNIPLPEKEVSPIVQEVALNGIIRGTKEYKKDEYVSGANTATSTKVFPDWTEGGKVFYKVRLKTLSPQNFRDASDMGTLAVRYVVQPQDEKHTVLRIDARFVQDYRRLAHASNGSVEGAEYKAVRDKLDAIEAIKNQTEQLKKEARNPGAPMPEKIVAESSSLPGISSDSARTEPAAKTDEPAQPQNPPQTLEERVQQLRRQVQRLVKAPGAALKSAPFHTASTLQSLPAGEQVLIVIATPYWLGVETHAGQHGWILRDELELLP